MATVYLNSATGSDAYTYAQAQSSATPWQTMSKAHTSATTGDTVILQSSATVYTFPNLTITKNLTWQAANIGDAIVDGTAGAASWTMGVYGVTCENLIFQNVTTSALAMFYTAVTASKTMLFKNCRFKNITLNVSNNNAAVFCNLAPSSQVTMDLDLIACSFENINTPYSAIDSQIATITNNLSPNGSSIDFRMVNCSIIIPSATYQIKNVVQVIYPASGDVLTMENMIIDNLSGSTVTFARYYGGSASTYQTIATSCFHNITSPPTAFTSGSGNITTAPAYADVANGDYRLQPNSVCSFTGRLI